MGTPYHGGKQKYGKKIADAISKKMSEFEQIDGYVEPFCGMLGVYQYIPDLLGDDVIYLAGDIHKSVIMMWQKAQEGWEYSPREITEKEFYKLRDSKHSSPEKALIGSIYGFRAVYFKSYRTDITLSRIQKTVDRVNKVSDSLINVEFLEGGYEQFSDLKNFVIYCDPPYLKQKNYYFDGNVKMSFDHTTFWNWCREMSENNYIFVSEYSAPPDFEEIWSEGNEKLFFL